ncbi:MAG: proline--tRNA ligase [Solitalea-like symbiont of Tyrophagus putrescentiae]
MSNFLNKKVDFSKRYNEIIEKAGLAEHSSVKGCMVIKPYGYALWENMQKELDFLFKETGHENAYFPIFIPKSFFSKEASHVSGFAKECAVVTHYRLKEENNEIIVDEKAKLEEELIVRPTSETIIWNSYKNWIQSYRDLPILINQWANVVRWEMRSRLFLRTNEFLWQEGHTAHASEKEALEEATKILDIYEYFLNNFLAIKVLKGVKPEHERFAGALQTYCIEAMMQDGKALQAGTSHFLGQNFAKAFDVKFIDAQGQLQYVWATSWGVSTRLIGAIIMSHSDEKGLIIPPKVAPTQVVIVPVYKNQEDLNTISNYANDIVSKLKQIKIRSKFDCRENYKPGYKFADWELKGVPIRITIGIKEVNTNSIEITRRDNFNKEIYKIDDIEQTIPKILSNIHNCMYEKSTNFLNSNTIKVNNYNELKENIKKNYFIEAFWDADTQDAEKIKQETQATIRCIIDNKEKGVCISTGKETINKVIFAKAY